MEICLTLPPRCWDLKTWATKLNSGHSFAGRWFLSFTGLFRKLFMFSHPLISFGPTPISSGLRIQKGRGGRHQIDTCHAQERMMRWQYKQTSPDKLCHRETVTLILPGTESFAYHIDISSCYRVTISETINGEPR